jgi:diaminopimelate epimerase
MTLSFFKYQGTGNDFIILDNRAGLINNLNTEIIAQLCHRKYGIGADGLMLMNSHEQYDFEMIYYNADGKTSSMCGNGGRCMVKFAFDLGIHKYTYTFLAIDGLHEAEIEKNGGVKLRMNDVKEVVFEKGHYILNTGSPHFIKPAENVENVDVSKSGNEIRFSKQFEQEGINVNFVESLDNDSIFVRTYERGVEDETLSCGTGVTAAALVFAHNDRGFNRVEVKTLGGHLSVEFNKVDDQNFKDIWLCGPATFVYKGEIIIEN